MLKLSSNDVYVLATLAQHSADPASQARLLARLSDKALVIGQIIAKKSVKTATDADHDLARGFVKWVSKLGTHRSAAHRGILPITRR